MFHMLSCFDLGSDETIEAYKESLDQFVDHMKQIGLLKSVSPIGRRQKHPVMDTDAERDHEYFFTMTFANRTQCDLAVDHIYNHQDPGDTIHKQMYSKIKNPIFICWQDI